MASVLVILTYDVEGNAEQARRDLLDVIGPAIRRHFAERQSWQCGASSYRVKLLTVSGTTMPEVKRREATFHALGNSSPQEAPFKMIETVAPPDEIARPEEAEPEKPRPYDDW